MQRVGLQIRMKKKATVPFQSSFRASLPRFRTHPRTAASSFLPMNVVFNLIDPNNDRPAGFPTLTSPVYKHVFNGEGRSNTPGAHFLVWARFTCAQVRLLPHTVCAI